MKIECYLSQGCASEEALKTNIATAVENEGVKADISFYRIDDAEALSLGISGSPAVFLDKRELQPLGAVGFS